MRATDFFHQAVRTAEAQLFSSAGSADETFVQRIFGFLPFLQKGFIFRLTDELTDDINKGYIKVDGVSSVFCFIWGWEEPTWGLPFQFHGVFYVMISMKGP